MEARKRVLIVYYSLSGHTERVARDLALRLGADVEQVREHTNRRGLLGQLRAALDSARERPGLLGNLDRRASDYELTIVGTPVWVGKMTPAIRAYLKSICGRSNEVAFFTTSGNTPVEKVVPAMEKLAWRRAVASVGFTERELRDAAIYDGKLRAFIAALHVEPAAAVVVRRSVHAHA